MSGEISITGLAEVSRNIRKFKAAERRAEAAALKKVAIKARGAVRRRIVAEEGIKLKDTAKRVAWFWKKKGFFSGRPTIIKMWVGTGIPVRSSLKRSDFKRSGEFGRALRAEFEAGARTRDISIKETAERVTRPTVAAVHERDFRRFLASQLARFYAKT